ncbi:ArsR family transcriptional regulator [Mycetocola manganoxydans]|uniref:ArsR family transcriptional regulator n=2 Tax=Mycetocola manganoxydans TaxID=699879 RepID=A0A3L6ZTD9_9MICO|nr:ArsR family transcriptional regulator [Mycetocola manganoxydans]
MDPTTAAARAQQVAALANPDRLRLLSSLVTDPESTHTSASLAELLDESVAAIDGHLAELLAAGLVEIGPGGAGPTFRPSPDAWVRFGRLLRGKSGYQEPVATGAASPPPGELPPVILKIAERLAYRFSSHFSRETVTRYVAESYALLSERATVTRHLPSLTSRFATDRLGALATANGFNLTGAPEVLFVCVQNSGRSQMAAGILRQLAGDRANVRTAGSQPATQIDERIVDALDEIGVPIISEFPKPLTDEVVQAADVVITMGCGDACPVYPGRRYLDWAIPDPLELSTEGIRAVRDEIQSRVEGLLRSLNIAVRPN